RTRLRYDGRAVGRVATAELDGSDRVGRVVATAGNCGRQRGGDGLPRDRGAELRAGLRCTGLNRSDRAVGGIPAADLDRAARPGRIPWSRSRWCPRDLLAS